MGVYRRSDREDGSEAENRAAGRGRTARYSGRRREGWRKRPAEEERPVYTYTEDEEGGRGLIYIGNSAERTPERGTPAPAAPAAAPQDLGSIFDEIEKFVQAAEEEAELANPGPDSAYSKREKVLAMGVPEGLYDEMYEAGYFDGGPPDEEYVNGALKDFYASKLAEKVACGEVDYSDIKGLQRYLRLTADGEADGEPLTENMKEILEYVEGSVASYLRKKQARVG